MAKVLISMKDEFLNEIDKLADNEHCSRSELIREALRLYMRTRTRESSKLNIESLLVD
jgi:metal-responsive CopG/Arc/MetJ family transcriptional regulator